MRDVLCGYDLHKVLVHPRVVLQHLHRAVKRVVPPGEVLAEGQRVDAMAAVKEMQSKRE